MAPDDSTWIIHSLPGCRTEGGPPAPEPALHAFRSVLSPWRDEPPTGRDPVPGAPPGSVLRRGSRRAAG